MPQGSASVPPAHPKCASRAVTPLPPNDYNARERGNPLATLRLTLLGGFELAHAAGDRLAIRARKTQALLAWLALHHERAQTRDRLAGLLWPESDTPNARHSLRQALASLRAALGPHAATLLTDGETLGLTPGALDTDVASFERLAGTRLPETLERAGALYRGALLEGLVTGAEDYDDWLDTERRRLEALAIVCIDALATHYRSSGDRSTALQAALRLLALDPLRESTHRTLMALYAEQGDTAAALRQYQRCRNLLSRELGVSPQPVTDALHRSLLQHRPSGMPPLPQPAADATRGHAELRPAAVLYIRLPALSALTACMAPEALAALVERFRAAFGQAVSQAGGTVQRDSADAAVALFGLPTASGDEPYRAAYAAWAVRAAMEAGDPPADARPAAGVASGLLLSAGESRTTATGSALAAATTAAEQAAPGEILLTAAAFHAARHARGVALGPPGYPPLYRLAALEPVPREPTPLVGRELERRQLELLLAGCESLQCAHTLLIRGEAGIGKSRMLLELEAMARARGFACHRGWALDFGPSPALEVPRALAASLLALPADSDATAARTTLDALAAAAVLAPEQIGTAAEMLGLPPRRSERALLDAMDEEARSAAREDVLATLVQVGGPALLAVEDLHWADAPTQLLLAGLARRGCEQQLLLALTTRSEGEPLDPGWRAALGGVPLTVMDLGPLRATEALALARYWARDEDLAGDCARRAGGHPLFLQQLAALGAAAADEVPDSVQALVQARLDRLPRGERAAAQAAAVLGLRFQLSALRVLLDDGGYDPAPLVAAQLVHGHGERLALNHALLRDAIYAGLLPAERRRLHRRAADWARERDPALFAEHLERAEDPRAGAALLAAARLEQSRHRHDRALDQARRGLNAGADAPACFGLQLLVAELLRQRGETAAALDAYTAAQKLAGDARQRAEAAIGVAACQSLQELHAQALATLGGAETLALEADDPALLAAIHLQRGNTYFPQGRSEDCLAEHQRALYHARKAGDRRLEAEALSGLSDAWYQRGRMHSAHEQCEACLSLATEADLPLVAASNLPMRAMLRFYDLAFAESLDACRAALDVAARIGNRRAELLVRTIRPLVRAHQQDWPNCLSESRQAVTLSRALGMPRFESDALLNLGLGLEGHGAGPEALQMLETALRICRDCGGAPYSAAWILGVLAWVEPDPETRLAYLAEGEAQVARSCVSHNTIHFRQYAMEVNLALGAWDEAERHAAALEAYTREEPFAYADHLIARARALAAWGRGARGDAIRADLQRLEHQARSCGLVLGSPIQA